ncbi:MAG: thiamine diphosphokinase [Fimbriimonadales bacterium]
MRRIFGVLGGRDFPAEALADWARSADVVIAADSATDRLLAVGVEPHVVIGDLDSMKADRAGLSAEIVEIADQDRTDCDKLLDYANGLGPAAMVLAGVEGDRLDHVLSTLSSVARLRPDCRLLLRRGIGHVRGAGGSVRLETSAGRRCSVLPLPEAAVSLSGVRWPLSSEPLRLGGFVSISNETSGTVEFEVHSGVAMLVLETQGTPPLDW